MSTPDHSGGQGNQQDGGAGPTQYPPQHGQMSQPGQFGPPSGYNPYGQSNQPGHFGPPVPAYGGVAGLGGDDPGPVPRPGIMWLSLALLMLSALPFVLSGAVLLAFANDADNAVFPPEFREQLEQVAGPGQSAPVAQTLGGVLLAVSVLYVVLAVLAFIGRNWARIVLTIMSVLFAVILLLGILGSPAGLGSGVVMVVLLVACFGGGTAILFLGEPDRYLTSRSR